MSHERSLTVALSFAAAALCTGGCGPIEQLRLGGTMRDDSSLLGSTGYYADPEAGPCAVQTFQAKVVPLDLFILLDRSGSMLGVLNGGTRWSMIGDALAAFLNDPASAGIQVALQYFSQPVAGQTEPSDELYSCSLADYVKPAIAMGALPATAQPIIDSIRAHQPVGPTPTSIALVGAIDYCREWAKAHPSHHVAIVLATDGEPKGCNASTDNVSALAGTGFRGAPSIATYVIGVGGGLELLEPIAVGGGTSKAFLINNSTNATGEFIDAMQAVRLGQGLPCAYAIPAPIEGGIVDPMKVNLDYTEPTTGKPNLVPFFQVATSEQCSALGPTWYYDNPASPGEIRLCPEVCEQITHVTTGELSIAVGCQTRVIIN